MNITDIRQERIKTVESFIEFAFAASEPDILGVRLQGKILIDSPIIIHREGFQVQGFNAEVIAVNDLESFLDIRANGVKIIGVDFSENNQTVNSSISLASSVSNVLIHSCTFGGGNSITLGSGCSHWSFMGNDFDSANATTTASDGYHSFVGNRRTGALNLHAQDAQAGNT